MIIKLLAIKKDRKIENFWSGKVEIDCWMSYWGRDCDVMSYNTISNTLTLLANQIANNEKETRTLMVNSTL